MLMYPFETIDSKIVVIIKAKLNSPNRLPVWVQASHNCTQTHTKKIYLITQNNRHTKIQTAMTDCIFRGSMRNGRRDVRRRSRTRRRRASGRRCHTVDVGHHRGARRPIHGGSDILRSGVGSRWVIDICIRYLDDPRFNSGRGRKNLISNGQSVSIKIPLRTLLREH